MAIPVETPNEPAAAAMRDFLGIIPTEDLPAVAAPDGTEKVAVLAGAVPGFMTTQEIADLGAGGFTQAQIEEFSRDALGTALVAGSNITITPNDGSDTITIAASGASAPLTLAAGTATASAPIVTGTQTWNNAAVAFTGFYQNITVTASNNSGFLHAWARNGTTVARIDEFGGGLFGTLSIGTEAAKVLVLRTDGSITARSDRFYAWASGTNVAVAPDTALGRNAAGVVEINNGTAGTFRDLRARDLLLAPSASLTPANNGDLVIEKTSNTTLTFKLKGSDGTVRSAALTLA